MGKDRRDDMDEYERVAARLNNDTEGSISDIAAILRESFPQAEAGGELDEAWCHYHYEPFVGDPLNPDDKERVRRHGEACKKAFRAGFLAARPAPTAEKGLREALENIQSDCAKKLIYSTHHKCDYLALIQSINDRLRALLAHEAPKGNN